MIKQRPMAGIASSLALLLIPSVVTAAEQITCEARSTPTPGRGLLASVSVEVLNGKVLAGKTRKTFAVGYTPSFTEVGENLSITTAGISLRWPMPGSTSDGSILGKAAPELALTVRVLPGGRLSESVLVQYLDGAKLLFQGPATLRAGRRSDEYIDLNLNLALPKNVSEFSGPVAVKLHDADDGRWFGTAVFDLSGFAETAWHRANKDAGLEIGPDRKILSMAPGCTKRAVARTLGL